jgi:hypothetical protein
MARVGECDKFEDFQHKAGEGEDVGRRVVATISVAVLAENDVRRMISIPR